MRATTQHYWRNADLPFVELRSTHHSVQSYKPHFHPQLSFGAVIAGTTRALCRGRERLLQQGDLVLIAPHVVHSCNPVGQQPRSYHMLYLEEAWCLQRVPCLQGRSLAEVCGSGIVIRDAQLFARYLQLVAALAALPATTTAAALQRLLTEVLDRSCPPAMLPQDQQLAERVRRVLLDNVESPPALAALARAFGCRQETLIRAFRRAYHTTPRAFVNNVRIEQAKQRLRLGEQIAHVAADLGFADQAQLHRTFVSYTASTPGQYRRARVRLNFRQ